MRPRLRTMLLPLILFSFHANAADLQIAVRGVRNDRGLVYVAVCTHETFLKDCTRNGDTPAHAGTTIVTIHGLPPGRYAVQAFHDENGNGKVDRGLFGIPKEGVGFSNNAKIRFGPPSFGDAAFDLAKDDAHIGFELRYF